MRLVAYGLALSAVCAASAASAAGFELREFSAEAMGTAYAGAAASDASPGYLFYNPASLAGVEAMDVSVNTTGFLLASHGGFSATTAAGTPASGIAHPRGFISDDLTPASALRWRFSDRWTAGLTLSVPWGESTKYPDDFVGRYYALTTRFAAYDADPIIAFQALPNLSIGAGAQVQYVTSELRQALDLGSIGAGAGLPGAVPGGDDGFVISHGHAWGAGYLIGSIWKPMPDLSLGVSYRSEIKETLKGSEDFAYDTAGIAATINAVTGALANDFGRAYLPTPASVTGGARLEMGGGFAALAGVQYTNWSSLHELLIVPENPVNPSSVTPLDWKDTWFGSLGLEYQANDDWKFRLGTAYDEAAPPSPFYAIPSIPDADRYWVSGGAGYRWNDHIGVDFAVSHLFASRALLDESATAHDNALRGSLAGETKSAATLIGVQAVFR